MSFAPPPHPYPPDRYHGDTGEVSARLRPNDAPHDLESATGWTDYLVTGAATGGDYGLYRWHMSGPRSGPDPHFHKSLSESFFVLDGTIRLYDGSQWVTGRPGDFLYVPEGGVHAFRNESGDPATMLILFAPGAARERYFEGLVERALMSEKPTPEEMAEFYRRHDTYWV
ncbi:MAG TPA: cupin domain-containing protein [Jatrophihabitans sp.]|jgi:quercetin dioxygenase-like cupin family protein